MGQVKDVELEGRGASAEQSFKENNDSTADGETKLEEEVQYKSLNDFNLKALADDLGEVLTRHVGGPFSVTVAKVEHTHIGYTDNRLLLNFVVEDRYWFARAKEKR